MKMKSNIYRIQSILSKLFTISILLLVCTFLYSSFSKKYQLTSDSFFEISKINMEIRNLSPLQNVKFRDKEKLLFEMGKLVDSNISNFYYSFDTYVIENLYISEYYPDVEELKELKFSDRDLSILMKVKCFNKDSLHFKIDSIFKTMHLKYFYPSSYVNYDRYNYFCIKDISELVIETSVLNKLETIKNNQFSSTEDLKQKLREVLGIQLYKRYSNLIQSTIDRTPHWASVTMKITFYLVLIFIVCIFTLEYFISQENKKKSEKELEGKIVEAKEIINNEPNKATPVWDLANLTLQKYYDKNLSHVNSIYRLSIAVMIMGFFLIVSILIATIYYQVDIKYVSLGMIAGIITEFIGATFLFIYKSTIKQAMQYSTSLEDINKLGMSIKILEAIDITDRNKDKLDDAKIDIAKILISSENE